MCLQLGDLRGWSGLAHLQLKGLRELLGLNKINVRNHIHQPVTMYAARPLQPTCIDFVQNLSAINDMNITGHTALLFTDGHAWPCRERDIHEDILGLIGFNWAACSMVRAWQTQRLSTMPRKS